MCLLVVALLEEASIRRAGNAKRHDERAGCEVGGRKHRYEDPWETCLVEYTWGR